MGLPSIVGWTWTEPGVRDELMIININTIYNYYYCERYAVQLHCTWKK